MDWKFGNGEKRMTKQFRWGQKIIPTNEGKRRLGSLITDEGIYVGESKEKNCIVVIDKGKRRQTVYHKSFWRKKNVNKKAN